MRKLVFAALLLVSVPLRAEPDGPIVVICSRSSPLPDLTLEQLRLLYLGESRYVAGNMRVEIGERERGSAILENFYKRLTQLSPKDVAVHWARKVFTGAALPPAKIRGDDNAAKSWVKEAPSRVTYVYARSLDKSVKVLERIEP